MIDNGCKREMTFEEELLAFDARLKELLFAEDEYPGDSLLKSVLRDSKRILSKATAKIKALQMDNKQLQSDVINANMNHEHLQAENKRLLTEFLRLKEENAPPYLLINADAESTAEIIKTIKTQKALFVPDNEGTVEFFDKASIRAEAVKDCIEKIKARSSKAVMTDHGIPVAGSASYSISEVKLYGIEKEMVGEVDAT